ncbi:putative NUDIX hydrolase [Vibrio nigripulchritudo SOn1]|uniref:NUDIX hydrolase n=1 Tax=Vibrio nigripulchritudo SOn1 TaxID=1238450 RepID=A0AAV2VID5_9VIBR|nr:NUDIX hydrolase [Vibrio nigripulchritudo]CCO44495.1 putative NUDIX hydrolase [Vibrio nigripulchritudo SOn1]
MIAYQYGESRFNYRSAAVIFHQGHVLLHKSSRDDFWSLPGGRVELFEHSDETLPRELKEEIGLDSSVRRLLWHMENFYLYREQKYHELCNYFLVELDTPELIPFGDSVPGIEEDNDLVFRWFPLSEIDSMTIYPTILKKKLKQIPDSPELLKTNELPANALM